nr:tetratricopeptide repeat protein [Desulfobacterales bacterium]
MIRKKFFIITFTIFGLFFVSCTSYIEKHKKQEEAVRNLGEVYMSEGNYTFALRELLKAEKIYHNDPFLHNDLGLTYMAKDEKDLA